jgi:hypothetical protein
MPELTRLFTGRQLLELYGVSPTHSSSNLRKGQAIRSLYPRRRPANNDWQPHVFQFSETNQTLPLVRCGPAASCRVPDPIGKITQGFSGEAFPLFVHEVLEVEIHDARAECIALELPESASDAMQTHRRLRKPE